MEILVNNVLKWAEEKGIMNYGNPFAQMLKTKEEFEEFRAAIEAQDAGKETFVNAKGKEVNTTEEIKDSIGDQVVTLIIGAAMQNMTLEECLQAAYDVISKRTGQMIGGQFVKNEE